MTSCDFVDVGVREFLEGARDLESFGRAMKARFGKDIPPEVLAKAFEKAANRYAGQMSPLGDIKLELAKELAMARRSGFLETVTALRRAGLLSGPKTILRNLSGNALSMLGDSVARVPASLVDIAVGKFTGTRTVSPFNFDAAKRGWIASVTDGFREARDVLKTGMTDKDLARYEIPRELNAYVGSVELKPINAWVNYINRFQGAQDKPFRAYAFTRSLAEQAGIVADKEGLSGAARASRINGLVASPPEAMELQAIADAEQAVFANSNKVTDGMSAFGRSTGPVGQFALDTLVPFRKVPTNITGRILESTPPGAAASVGITIARVLKAGALDPASQKALSMAFGRGASGTALIVLGYRLAQSGRLTPGFSSDRSIRDREEAVGHSPGSLLISGRSYQLEGSPAGILLTLGASMYRDQTQGKTPKDLPLSAASNLGKEVLDLPMLQGLSDLEGSLRRPESEGGRFAKGLAASTVPSLVSTVAQANDSVERAADTPKEAYQSRWPVFRNMLPPKRDSLGQEIPNGSWWNPIQGKSEKADRAAREIDRLKVRFQKPSRIRDATDPLYDKDEASYQNRVRIVGEAAKAAAEKLIASERYQAWPDAKRASELEKKIRGARASATKRLKSAAVRAARQKLRAEQAR